jgi:YbgC/YbaW family acyl-CoA thioester hydrolase
MNTVLRTRSMRVAMADVDAAAVLYFTTPLRWQETMFTGWLYELGHPVSAMLAEGRGCPAVDARVEFLAPLRLDDIVRCELRCVHLGTTSFGVQMAVMAESTGEIAARTSTRQVYCERDAGGTPRATPIPDWLRDALTTGGA